MRSLRVVRDVCAARPERDVRVVRAVRPVDALRAERVVLVAAAAFVVFRRRVVVDAFFFGTLPPALRASDNPIAIACLRLVTFLRERPLLSVPFLRSLIAVPTFFFAVAPYFVAMSTSSMQ